MSTPNPRLVTSGTLTTLPAFSFGTVTGGTTSSVWSADLVNDGATCDDVTEISIYTMESDDNGATWNQTGALTTGRWVSARAIGVDGDDIENQTTAWTPVGVGARLSLNPIPADARRQLEIEVRPPAGVTTATKKFKLCVDWRQSSYALSQGFYEAGIHGVCGGTGDPGASFLILGGDGEETGTPDNDLQIEDALNVWKYKGIPHVLYATSYTFAPSAAGKARWIAIYAGDGPDLESVESAEVTAPAPLSDQQALAVPDGQTIILYVHRDDGALNNADIYYPQTSTYKPFNLYVSSGLNCVVGAGTAIVDNNFVTHDKDQSVTVANNTTSIVYILPDGTVESVASGSDPSSSRAEPIRSLTTAAGAVTVNRDLRRWLGPERFDFESFFAGTVTTANAAYWTVPTARTAYVLVPEGMTLETANLGDRTTLNLEGELEYWNGAAWVSAFSDATMRPKIAHGTVAAGVPYTVTGFLPDTCAFAAGTMIRHRIALITAAGGTIDPKDVRMRTPFELVSA